MVLMVRVGLLSEHFFYLPVEWKTELSCVAVVTSQLLE